MLTKGKYQILIREKKSGMDFEKTLIKFYPMYKGDKCEGMKQYNPTERMSALIDSYLDEKLVEKYKLGISIADFMNPKLSLDLPAKEFFSMCPALCVCYKQNDTLPYIHYFPRDKWNDEIEEHITGKDYHTIVFIVEMPLFLDL